ncbi:MAG: YXWGXW repeat-containing protein [Candidatus Acidiferrales bacterium]
MMRNCRFLPLFLLALLALAIPRPSQAQVAVGISVHIGPPPLRVYAQPICPGPDYLWTPGYWGYGDAGYYWVPGVWVMAPQPGLLWTPGYWGWGGGAYLWHAGYWGPHIGFYGGINYGFGYGGAGFVGGEWRGGHFFYNTAVMHVNVALVHNTYVNRTVIVHNNSHVAFNGGEGGIRAEPTREEMAAAHEQHFEATSAQMNHEHSAMARPGNRPANFNRPNNANRGGQNFSRPNNASHNNANNGNRNERQMKESKPAHNSKPPKNNHPQKDDHKPGDRP